MDPSSTFGNTTEFMNAPIDNLLQPIHTFYTNNTNGILSTLQPQLVLITYAPAFPILLHTPTTCPLSIPCTPLQIKGELHLKFPIPAHPFTVKLQIWLYLIHFF